MANTNSSELVTKQDCLIDLIIGGHRFFYGEQDPTFEAKVVLAFEEGTCDTASRVNSQHSTGSQGA